MPRQILEIKKQKLRVNEDPKLDVHGSFFLSEEPSENQSKATVMIREQHGNNGVNFLSQRCDKHACH